VNSTVRAAERVRVGNYRWSICALLFFATTINYVDRQVIGILKPTLQTQFGWNEIDYSNIVFAFQVAYAMGLLMVGRVIDRIGVHKGFSLAVVVWSLAAMAHALARSVLGFEFARFALGIGEAANFPASIKTVAEWHPRKERALATGIFNAGSNVGIIVAALLVPWLTSAYGWQWAFIATGALGFVWLIAWVIFYTPPEKQPRLSAAELSFIRSDAEVSEKSVPWASIVGHRQTWAFAIGKMLTDPIWWVYLFWIPDFLNRTYGLSLSQIGVPLITIYLLADIGSVGGGWISSSLIRRGWTVNRGRKTAMLVSALAVVPVIFAARASSLTVAVLLIGLAAAAHQGWSANIFTLASDMFPRRAVGSVVGFGGMFGAIGGMVIAKVVGYILEWTDSYVPIFILAGSAYLIALLVIHLLAPTLEPAAVQSDRQVT
jgi:ACS family hexuronate transporter-like MFS transporter